jgi:hypothetical protein
MKTGVLVLSFAVVAVSMAATVFAASIDYYENTEVTDPYTWDGLDPANVLLIQDQPGWGYNSHIQILNSCGIPHDIINSSGIAAANFDAYAKIITVGQQPDNYYYTIQANSAKFTDYMSSGGLVAFETANYFGGANEFITWPGGFTAVINQGSNSIAIDNEDNCLLFGVTNAELQGWNYSAHGIHQNLPAGYISYLSTLDGFPNGSCSGLFAWGSGAALVSHQPLEWAYGFGLSITFPTNFDCCDYFGGIPTWDGACCIGDQGECRILTGSECSDQGGEYQGNETTCEPVNPCLPVATVPSTWGSIKGLFR